MLFLSGCGSIALQHATYGSGARQGSEVASEQTFAARGVASDRTCAQVVPTALGLGMGSFVVK